MTSQWDSTTMKGGKPHHIMGVSYVEEVICPFRKVAQLYNLDTGQDLEKTVVLGILMLWQDQHTYIKHVLRTAL